MNVPVILKDILHHGVGDQLSGRLFRCSSQSSEGERGRRLMWRNNNLLKHFTISSESMMNTGPVFQIRLDEVTQGLSCDILHSIGDS